MGTWRNVAGVTAVVGIAVFIAAWLAVESSAQAPEKVALSGVWTLNREASDQPPSREDRGDSRERGRGGFGRGGGMGRGGSRGGGGGGRQGGMSRDPQDMARMRDAIRDIMNPSNRLTIVQTDTMVLVTGADGRTTRLSPNGSKIKEENTNIERKTKWDGGRLVSEISGLGPGKITQTFSLDPEHHQLRIAVQTEGGRMGQARTITHVYDAEER